MRVNLLEEVQGLAILDGKRIIGIPEISMDVEHKEI